MFKIEVRRYRIEDRRHRIDDRRGVEISEWIFEEAGRKVRCLFHPILRVSGFNVIQKELMTSLDANRGKMNMEKLPN